jgi:hypothetical protein
LRSVRLSGIFGISPEANPTTRYLLRIEDGLVGAERPACESRTSGRLSDPAATSTRTSLAPRVGSGDLDDVGASGTGELELLYGAHALDGATARRVGVACPTRLQAC